MLSKSITTLPLLDALIERMVRFIEKSYVHRGVYSLLKPSLRRLCWYPEGFVRKAKGRS